MKLLLLDLSAQRDGFLTDDGMNRLAAELESAERALNPKSTGRS